MTDLTGWRDLMRQERATQRATAEVESAAAEPQQEEPEELVFKVKLPPTTVGERWELARFLEETAERTVPSSRWGPRTAGWEMALIGVLTDLATAAREAEGKAVASAEEARHVASVVTISADVPLNQEARQRLHRVFRISVGRAKDGSVEPVVRTIADAFERFVYGRGGEPQEDPRLRRRQDQRPGMWEPVGFIARWRG